jgi:hypothetical protein
MYSPLIIKEVLSFCVQSRENNVPKFFMKRTHIIHSYNILFGFCTVDYRPYIYALE